MYVGLERSVSACLIMSASVFLACAGGSMPAAFSAVAISSFVMPYTSRMTFSVGVLSPLAAYSASAGVSSGVSNRMSSFCGLNLCESGITFPASSRVTGSADLIWLDEKTAMLGLPSSRMEIPSYPAARMLGMMSFRYS